MCYGLTPKASKFLDGKIWIYIHRSNQKLIRLRFLVSEWEVFRTFFIISFYYGIIFLSSILQFINIGLISNLVWFLFK